MCVVLAQNLSEVLSFKRRQLQCILRLDGICANRVVIGRGEEFEEVMISCKEEEVVGVFSWWLVRV